VPLKFGPETLTSVVCARASVVVEDRQGRRAQGWGETPLSVQWAWPAPLSTAERQAAMQQFCCLLAAAWTSRSDVGHPLELGHEFQRDLPELLAQFNGRRGPHPMPRLAALICLSALDLAVHDAYGVLHQVDTYQTYTPQYLSRDLAAYLQPEDGAAVDFRGRFPADFLSAAPPSQMRAWHLVGGVDPLEPADLTGDEPQDGEPVLLADWIHRDGLDCLKVKLKGTDADWDFQRLVLVGQIAAAHHVLWLSADFNCTVRDPAYVNQILDRLRDEHPRLYGLLLYVEQPFPYELEAHPIDVRSVAARKPLFLDESAHDWHSVRLGRRLGWSGVALKTCKTQTGAILALCWARAHGMPLMVQDLTNPMLAQIPHLRLAAHAGTIMGVETNSMQFYPDASRAEAALHPGIYTRRRGVVDLSTLAGPGLGYAGAERCRELPRPAAVAGEPLA
jgi:L-alanine-DL-glutamate epimerase-like enolase superfamily enzyme